MRTDTVAAVSLSLFVAAASPAASADRVQYGGGLLLGSASGEFRDHVKEGGGLAGQLVFTAAGGVLGLRLDGSWLLYGSETLRVTVPRGAGRLSDEITTDNWIGHLALGPMIMARSGSLRPYAHGFAGVSYFGTSSELYPADPYLPVESSTNHEDTAFSYGGGAGLLIPLGGGGNSLDLGARYVANQRVSFLKRGDIRSDGHGGIAFEPRRSAGNLLEFRLGIVVGGRPPRRAALR